MFAAAIAALIYGILALVGGWIGYKQAGSTVSLTSGIITGLLLLIAGTGMFKGMGWGLWLGLAVTALLLVTFVVRLIKTRKLMPAGLMVTVGVITLVVMIAGVG